MTALLSRTSFSSVPPAELQLSSPSSLTVDVIHESEISTLDSTTKASLMALYGELKGRQCYPLMQGENSKILCVLPKEHSKKVNGETSGKEHASLCYGGFVASQLLALPGIESRTQIHLQLSSSVHKILQGNEESFLIGLKQRGLSNRAFRAESDKPKVKLNFKVSSEVFTEQHCATAHAFNRAMEVTRTLINTPPNMLRPDSYEAFVRQLVKDFSSVTLEAVPYEELQKLGCGLICAVGQGSDVKPRILKLKHKAGSVSKKVAIVGKGITFDSGGLDIKTSAGMRNMKKDMGGSAAALGIFLALAGTQVEGEVSCYLALAENMVSGNSMRPGDVHTARNGMQVEIENTDAEGRLVLADALCLAVEEKPDWIIDLATLTGAARIALGPVVDALFSNSKEHADRVLAIGKESGDWFWQMPLVDDYEAYYDSTVSDFTNCSAGGLGGAITAALFLRRFVKNIAWCHIDTYMWNDKATDLYAETGASAKCVRAVSRAVREFLKT